MKKETVLWFMIVAAAAAAAVALAPVLLYTMPTVYSTGTTIYKREKCWNGYTIYGYGADPDNPKPAIANLIDMNGNVVHKWENIQGFPYKVFPGGLSSGAVRPTTRRRMT